MNNRCLNHFFYLIHETRAPKAVPIGKAALINPSIILLEGEF